MRVTEEAMWRGIAAARLGGRVGDISQAIESYVHESAAATGSSRTTPATASGPQMHQPPDVPNYGRRRGPKLVEGLALAVEPMITLGTKETAVLADDWTVVTARRVAGPRTTSTRSRSPPTAPGC